MKRICCLFFCCHCLIFLFPSIHPFPFFCVSRILVFIISESNHCFCPMLCLSVLPPQFPHSIYQSLSKPLTILSSLLHPDYHRLYFNASLSACSSVTPSPFPLMSLSLPSSCYLCPADPLILPAPPAFYFHHNYLCISLIASLPKCHYVSS